MTSSLFAARHTCDSPEWYTPSPFVEAAREVMGGIDLDPASHEEANRTVRAAKFYTAEDDGLKQPWSGRVFLNPPGEKDQHKRPLVPQFWRNLMVRWFYRDISEAIWIGYSLEQLQSLQNAGAGGQTPLDFAMCIPRRRIAFVENEAKKAARIAKLIAAGKDPNEKSQPSHANYVTYIGPNGEAFKRVFGQFGVVRL